MELHFGSQFALQNANMGIPSDRSGRKGLFSDDLPDLELFLHSNSHTLRCVEMTMSFRAKTVLVILLINSLAGLSLLYVATEGSRWMETASFEKQHLHSA